jgi:predicted HAD superfamily Cof-like phosphohydrolase
MKKFAEKVIEFNRKVLGINQLLVKMPLVGKGKEFVADAVAEENTEFDGAVDVVGQVDALIDMIYFAVGGLYKIGLTAEEISDCCDLVHDANMVKAKGKKEGRGDGTVPDAVKAVGWVGPEEMIRYRLSNNYEGHGTKTVSSMAELLKIEVDAIHKLSDSGKREEFPGGMVREPNNDRGRYDLISPIALRALAIHYERGAKKYSDRNWEKGGPLSRHLNSAMRHLQQYLEGDRNEDHLSACCFNCFAITHHTTLGRIDLDDLPAYKEE